ncbi:retinol dehydrogenase 14-like [Coccinella septempunctata]|uniref:retinol dehydrogenase 14-like n=1 Tax=Coccinella septempunctata TaxID=41139 RepID=UPI001D08043B|nr:retinol dehydrogenase 14-like [Coccinella septempunctata]
MFSIFLIILFILVLFRWFTGKRSDNVSCLIGKTAIVTGGNEGIGFAIVLLLASRGCKVIIADKASAETSVEKAKKLTKNNEIYSRHLDLSSFASIRSFAEDIKMSETKIDILINNAGVNAIKRFITEDGLGSTMQINYFGAFLLTHLLLDTLKAAEQARIIFAGSIFAFFNNLSVDNLEGTDMSSQFVFKAYCNSKYCNIFAAQEFGERLKNTNITVYAADPGVIKTRIFEYKTKYTIQRFLKTLLLWIFGSEPMVGAQTAFHLAASEEMKGKTGEIYVLCKPWTKLWNMRDPEFSKQIWEKSEILVKLKPNERI